MVAAVGDKGDNLDSKRRNVATPSKNVLGKGSPEKPSALVTKTPEKGPLSKNPLFHAKGAPGKQSPPLSVEKKSSLSKVQVLGGSLGKQSPADKTVRSIEKVVGKNSLAEKSADRTVPVANVQSLKVCGPEFIQTLRGKILGREVAVICCGEAHEKALDLTRTKGIIEATRGWVPVPNVRAPGFDPSDATRKNAGLTLEQAKTWAKNWPMIEEDETDNDGVHLLYLPDREGSPTGVAYYFGLGKEARKARGSIPVNAVMFKWFDLDDDVRADKERMTATCSNGTTGRPFREAAHDATVAKRKEQRRAEGYELLDDWLLRRYAETEGNKKSKIRMHFVHEHSVPLSELELHVEPGVQPTPPAHECLMAMELDSDTDSAEDRDPDDGTGGFADYLSRRVEDNFAPGNVHGVDPRNLGDPPDGDKAVATLKTIENFKPMPRDSEEVELSKLRAEYPKDFAKKHGYTADKLPRRMRNRMPSWELYFGQAAEFLYHSGNVKADYGPFLATCLPTPQRVFSFFEDLYFGTVPQAVTHLGDLNDEAKSKTRIRSLAHRPAPKRALKRRPTDNGLTPVKAAPLDRYLKARGSNPPRTWVSGLSNRLADKGGKEWVEALQVWYRKCVVKILSDPKRLDKSGDYFAAYLRESHPDIYKQIDPSDPEELRKMTYAATLDKPDVTKKRHYLGNIEVPKLEKSLQELASLNTGEVITSSKRQRVLAKIIVDAFQLRLVDVATILKVALIAASAPIGSKLAIVFYGGADHTSNLAKFFKEQGFSHEGLSRDGLVHCKNREPGESCGLKLPAYLHDFEQLFPVPDAQKKL